MTDEEKKREKELKESIALAEKYHAEASREKAKQGAEDESYEPYVLAKTNSGLRKNTRQGWKILFLLALLLVLVAVIFLVHYVLTHKKSEEKIDELRDYNTIEDMTGQAEDSEEGVESTKPIDIPVDFEKLQAENADIYAWIYIPNTEIDYPILQHPTNNAFYLTHDVSKAESVDGSIYTEDYNAKDFHDFHTVIYGHNMKNGSMFQNLHMFEDPEFADTNRYIYIYTPDAIRTYQIFAIYNRDDRHLLYSMDYSDESVRQDYIASILNNENLDGVVYEDVDVTIDNTIITLSTCNSHDDQRFLVQGVLISEEK